MNPLPRENAAPAGTGNRVDHVAGKADCQQHSLEPRITQAAAWLVDHWHVAPRPLTRTLREMFELTFNDACKAIAEARRIGGEQ